MKYILIALLFFVTYSSFGQNAKDTAKAPCNKCYVVPKDSLAQRKLDSLINTPPPVDSAFISTAQLYKAIDKIEEEWNGKNSKVGVAALQLLYQLAGMEYREKRKQQLTKKAN